MLTAVALAVLAAAAHTPVAAQQQGGVAGTALLMRQLDGVKRVLMIGAHPDDEDTGLLATLARGMGAETAYLSLSRGEGGQNFIGPRLHEGLGVIRTGELLAARALDGAGQYFTRAYDFGYSKSLDETLELWPLEEVLRDVVFVVRKFRPHVIVSVFSATARSGHGQHQLAGVAARDAFAAAGDPQRFPELAAHGVTPWAPSKLYRSVRFSPRDATLSVPSGDFDPVLGRSHFQVAMESRSRHRSQEMGSGQAMGPRASPLRLEASSVEGFEDDGIFAGVDTTLIGQLGTPLPAGWPADTERRLDRYRGAVAEAGRGLSGASSDGTVAGLAEAAAILQGLVSEAPEGDGKRVLERRLAQVSEAVLSAAGVVTEVRVGRGLLTPGESVLVDVTVWNGGTAGLAGVDPALLLPDRWEASRTEESAQAGVRVAVLSGARSRDTGRRADRGRGGGAVELARDGAPRCAALGAVLPGGRAGTGPCTGGRTRRSCGRFHSAPLPCGRGSGWSWRGWRSAWSATGSSSAWTARSASTARPCWSPPRSTWRSTRPGWYGPPGRKRRARSASCSPTRPPGRGPVSCVWTSPKGGRPSPPTCPSCWNPMVQAGPSSSRWRR